MRLFTALLVAAGLALAFAACGDDDDDAGGSDSSSTALVSVQDVSGDEVLADDQGRTLYTADVESDGEISCEGDCTSIWDPVVASVSDASTAADELGLDLGTVERPDGGEQLALDGAPLYAFTEEGPGELTGDGFEDDFQGTHFVWSAARASGGASEPAGSGDSPSYGGGY